jgi:hypothetical protein
MGEIKDVFVCQNGTIIGVNGFWCLKEKTKQKKERRESLQETKKTAT